MRYKSSETSALEKIDRALEELLQKKNYSDITCSDIIKESGVSRSTFYLYFKNKDQVVTHLCDNIFNHVFSSNLSKEKHHDFSSAKEDDLKHLITHSYCHFLEDKELILSILNSGASSIFLQQLRRRIKPLVTALVEQKIIGNNDVPLDIKVHQYINGYTALLQYYLRHAESELPETMSEYYFKMTK